MKTDKKYLTIPDYMVIIKSLEIMEKTKSNLFKETGITYAHITKICKLMIEQKWIATRKEDRKIFLFLTDKGKEISSVLNVLLKTMEYSDNDIIKYQELRKDKRLKLIDGVEEERPDIPKVINDDVETEILPDIVAIQPDENDITDTMTDYESVDNESK